ncbi:hypothetical protein LTR37_020491 [Vermiconidia calcicola]|uniref:Uncharacterized protein n=1 Tax=Vermiconidia calcicola TaxID=1690605 RepID=A0ACC3MCH8_9PEZI|nr:hypothetical protein LTR37_020491 [Vermiconidia calcicola]
MSSLVESAGKARRRRYNGAKAETEEFKGTLEDQRQMRRMGLTQETRRGFKIWGMVGFVSSVMMSPQMAWNIMPYTLYDGAPGAFFWGLLLAVPTFALTYTSLAELTAMIPAAGGQYQWISELAPRQSQKSFSYIMGWLLTLGWQTYVALVCFTCASGILGLSSLIYDFTPQPYQVTLTTCCLAILAGLVNTFFSDRLPILEIIAGISHVLGPPAFLITFLVLSPLNNAHDAFLGFTNLGGWSMPSTAGTIGMYLQASLFVGYDCTVHMSEEINDASKTMPQVLKWAFVLNLVLMLLTNLTFMFCIPHPGHILNTPTGIPYIQLFYDATQSLAGASICVVKILVDLGFAGVSEQACASRQLWAFSRNNGVPFSSYLRHVPDRWNVPVASIWVSVACTCLLSCINLGSALALNALISLGGTSIIMSYIFSIGCTILRRQRHLPLPDPSKAFLGSKGMAVNIGALVFLLPLLLFVNFPLFDHPGAAGLNWSPVLFGAVAAFSAIYYVVWGRNHYDPPLDRVSSNAVLIDHEMDTITSNAPGKGLANGTQSEEIDLTAVEVEKR